MKRDDPGGLIELPIFRAFVEVCQIPIRADSIQKRQEPEPDIWCEVEGVGPVAFEMTESIDATLAQQVSDQLALKHTFETEYEALPAALRAELRGRLGNALIHVDFRPGFSLRRRKQAARAVLDALLVVDPGFLGGCPLRPNTTLAKMVREISIDRGAFTGPCFDASRAVPIKNQTVDRLREKFQRSHLYRTQVPIELIVYYQLQAMPAISTWLPGVQKCVREEIGDSAFRRVWLFDVVDRAIRFVYPEETASIHR